MMVGSQGRNTHGFVSAFLFTFITVCTCVLDCVWLRVAPLVTLGEVGVSSACTRLHCGGKGDGDTDDGSGDEDSGRCGGVDSAGEAYGDSDISDLSDDVDAMDEVEEDIEGPWACVCSYTWESESESEEG